MLLVLRLINKKKERSAIERLAWIDSERKKVGEIVVQFTHFNVLSFSLCSRASPTAAAPLAPMILLSKLLSEIKTKSR
jgi:hypothetical protein